MRALLELAVPPALGFDAVLQLRDQILVLVQNLRQLPFEMLQDDISKQMNSAAAFRK